MDLQSRIQHLLDLGKILGEHNSDQIQSLMYKCQLENPWFTIENITTSMDAIQREFLTVDALLLLVKKYHLDDHVESKKIGIIMAGNLPMVGFHDLLCSYIIGHHSIIKLSDKDRVLMEFVIQYLQSRSNTDIITIVDKLTDYDAAIATGSNSTAKHFEYYFRSVPHIIRQNRNSIAIIFGDESDETLQLLGADIFNYFGLGCRNVSKIMLPVGFDPTRLFSVLAPFKNIVDHTKYKNNLDYNTALYLLNKEDFLQSDFLILKESDSMVSRIATLHYSYFSDIKTLESWLNDYREEIQCVVSQRPIDGIDTVSFGQSQCPGITDYADGVDTIQFLLGV